MKVKYGMRNRKKDLNRVVDLNKFTLIHPFGINYCNKKKYFNVSVASNTCTGMAEWLIQFIDIESPYGFVGSNPTPGVFNNFGNNININEVMR
jgi:hypothetical protein